MPRRRKPARELTRDELARRVFPPKVIREAKKLAQKRGGKGGKDSSTNQDTT